MNILYLSHLSNNIFAGPNFSVPAGIKAQQNYDNCYWVNLTHAFQNHWGQVECYHGIEEFDNSSFDLKKLPSPFSTPDLVVFEGFYNQGLFDPLLAKKLRRKRIPYIIVPRGSLTKQAMNNHGNLKKQIAHFLFYDSYCKKALAIQFLTEQEYRDSYKEWSKNHLVIPNGFNEPEHKKILFSENGIKMIFIGRPDIYHKGLDILWEAMRTIREDLVRAKVTLDFYGPRGKYDYVFLEKQAEEFGLQNIVTMHDQIGGVEKENAILSSDLFVMTSRFEGHPMGLVEALAYGIPALVTPGTNMADEINEADAGWVCEGDASSIAKELSIIIKEKDKLHEKSVQAIRVSKQYEWNRIALDFHNKVQVLL